MGSPSRKIALALATVAVAATGATASASPAPVTAAKAHQSNVAKLLWGLTELPGGRSPVPLYHKLGVDYFQYQLVWSRIAQSRPAHPKNPNDPAYVWPKTLDDFIGP